MIQSKFNQIELELKELERLNLQRIALKLPTGFKTRTCIESIRLTLKEIELGRMG